MYTAIVHLTPILAAEKSKTPFYIAGGLLVAWALIVSLGVGLRNPSFPGTVGIQRAVMGVSAALVLLAVSMAVVTSGGSSEKANAATAPPGVPAGGATPGSGGGVPAPAGGVASTLKEAANPEGQLRYTTASLTAKAGKVTIDFANASPLPHNMTVALGKQVLGATPTFQGGSKTLALDLKPGTYTFYCSVPGHRAAGMEGHITVQ
jgi:plastocyanin